MPIRYPNDYLEWNSKIPFTDPSMRGAIEYGYPLPRREATDFSTVLAGSPLRDLTEFSHLYRRDRGIVDTPLGALQPTGTYGMIEANKQAGGIGPALEIFATQVANNRGRAVPDQSDYAEAAQILLGNLDVGVHTTALSTGAARPEEASANQPYSVLKDAYAKLMDQLGLMDENEYGGDYSNIPNTTVRAYPKTKKPGVPPGWPSGEGRGR